MKKLEIDGALLGQIHPIQWQGKGKLITDHLAEIDQAFLKLEENQDKFPEGVLTHYAACLVHLLITLMQAAEVEGMTRYQIRDILPNSWRIHGQSSFGKHIQEWPHGYPGDFEAVNMIVDFKEDQPPTTLAGALGRIALYSPIAQQHREKLIVQSREVGRVCRNVKNPKILSIACGPSRDLENVQQEIKSSGAEVWLVDFDKDALDESKERLSSVSEQIRLIHANVKDIKNLFKILGESGGFNYVYAGGLLDYLPNRFIQYFLMKLSPLVLPSSSLMFTNINLGNPYRVWIEIMGNWRLKERGADTMEEFLAWTNCERKILELDQTGLTWLAKAIR